jgi:hypothetical protein
MHGMAPSSRTRLRDGVGAATRQRPLFMAVPGEAIERDEVERFRDLAFEADEVIEVLGPKGLKGSTRLSGDIAEHLETRDRRDLKQVG